MKTTGQILKETRLSRHIDLDQVSTVTKIRPALLGYLEADNYGRLPSATVAKGFIRNYAKFLGLNPDHLLSLFRRDFVENQQGQIVPRGMVDPVNQISFWTPRTTIIAFVTLVFTLFGAYMLYQYRILTGPPALTLQKPLDYAEVTGDTVEVVGTTDPEASLSVNSQPVVLEKGGQFHLRLPLVPGENIISVTSLSKSGKSTTISRIVTLK